MVRDIQILVNVLIEYFPTFLKAFEQNCPFNKFGQLEYHKKTIHIRRELGSVQAALEDPDFQQNLFETLRVWGIGSRASSLRPFPQFIDALMTKEDEIMGLEKMLIDQPNLSVSQVSKKLSRVVCSIDIVTNQAKLVAGSKALHHILPDLIVPMDRAYTQNFFGWSNPKFQYSQSECFEEAFHSFVAIARAVNPEQYVGDGWNTSGTKVIDNALVGVFCGGIELVKSNFS